MSALEHWDELPIDELRTRIADLEAWKAESEFLLERLHAILIWHCQPNTRERAELLDRLAALLGKEVPR